MSQISPKNFKHLFLPATFFFANPNGDTPHPNQLIRTQKSYPMSLIQFSINSPTPSSNRAVDTLFRNQIALDFSDSS